MCSFASASSPHAFIHCLPLLLKTRVRRRHRRRSPRTGQIANLAQLVPLPITASLYCSTRHRRRQSCSPRASPKSPISAATAAALPAPDKSPISPATAAPLPAPDKSPISPNWFRQSPPPSIAQPDIDGATAALPAPAPNRQSRPTASSA